LYCTLKICFPEKQPKIIGQKKSAEKVGQKKSAEKSRQKKVSKKCGNKRQQKMQQERWEKSLFLNLSCCCLETSLKPGLF